MPPRQRTSTEDRSLSVAHGETEPGCVPGSRDASEPGLSELAQGLIRDIMCAEYPGPISSMKLFSRMAMLPKTEFPVVEEIRRDRFQRLGEERRAMPVLQQEELIPPIPSQAGPWLPSGVLETMSPAEGPDPRMAQLPPRDRE